MAVIGPHGWIIGEILLQEPGSQFPCERAGPTFPLHEGDGRWILAAVEIEIEGGSCLVKPLLAKWLAARRCGVWMLVHVLSAGDKGTVVSLPWLSHAGGAAAITGMDPGIS